jgi:hypothetical protein
MAYKHYEEPLIPYFYWDISFPSIFALFTSIGALLLSEPLLSYSTKNPHDQLINLLIRFLLFILVPISFLLGVGLLMLSVAVPFNSPHGEIYAAQIDQLRKTTVAMALASLLAAVAIGVSIALPDAVGAWWFGW